MPYPSKTDRQTVLTTAMNQVARDGIERLAVRSVAAALDLAPNALYRYFPSLSALEAALAEESRRRLFQMLNKAAGKKPPQEAIRGIAYAYLRFARQHPNVFALSLRPVSNEKGEEAAHLLSWRLVLGLVAQLCGEERAPRAAVALWAFLHGMTALEAARVFGGRKPAGSFEFGLQMWIDAASA